MKITPYNPSNKKEVLELLRLNTPDYFAFEEEEEFDEYLEQKREMYYVLFIKEIIVGCGGINIDEENNIAKLSWDIVHPLFKGKGIGTALVDFRIFQIRKLKNINKVVVRTSQLVYKFYEAKGFSLKFIKKDFWAKGFDLYYMELTIK